MSAADGLAVGVDIGGTKLAAGLVAADGTVLGRARRTTPAREHEAIVPLVAELVDELTRGHDVARALPVGVGAAGIVDRDGVIRYAPNIDWRDYPLRTRLEAHLGGPVTVENDANVAAWGEFRFGAAADAPSSMAMFTVGTGVGGGLVLHGRLVRGAGGLAGELGHVIVREGGARCPCGNLGCLEAYASGTSMGRRAADAAKDGTLPRGSLLARLPLPELTGKEVTLAAHRGDAFARELVADTGRWLGVGIAAVVNALDPAVVVVGGGALQAGELLLEPAREAVEQRLVGRAHRTAPPILRAALADDAGIVGAALLAMG